MIPLKESALALSHQFSRGHSLFVRTGVCKILVLLKQEVIEGLSSGEPLSSFTCTEHDKL